MIGSGLKVPGEGKKFWNQGISWKDKRVVVNK